jgi:uncharacterized membrane protein
MVLLIAGLIQTLFYFKATNPGNSTISYQTPVMKKSNFIYPLFACSLLFLNFVSCSKGDSTPETTNSQTGSTSGTPGPLFNAVKTLMDQKCVSCHNAGSSAGGRNFQASANIVAGKDRIKVRAVDEGTMPPSGTLPQADKNTIMAWVNAGGRLTD